MEIELFGCGYVSCKNLENAVINAVAEVNVDDAVKSKIFEFFKKLLV